MDWSPPVIPCGVQFSLSILKPPSSSHCPTTPAPLSSTSMGARKAGTPFAPPEWPRVQVSDELIYAATTPPRRPTSYRYVPGSPGYQDERSLPKQVRHILHMQVSKRRTCQVSTLDLFSLSVPFIHPKTGHHPETACHGGAASTHTLTHSPDNVVPRVALGASRGVRLRRRYLRVHRIWRGQVATARQMCVHSTPVGCAFAAP